MFKILLMPDANRLCEAVDKCRGDVTMHLPGGTVCSLKNDDYTRGMLALLQTGQKRSSSLNLSLSDSEDFPVLFRYLLEAAKAA